ncbi:hypothetical protein MXB_5686, partial [Myxobolus squamalis]
MIINQILGTRLKYCKSGFVELEKASNNLLGICIGGGAPQCPILFISQVFDNTPAFNSGILEPGDELISINGCSCQGWSRGELAKFIQSIQGNVTVEYRKIDCNLEEGKILKKLKHKFIENVSFNTAEILGLSRAAISNDIGDTFSEISCHHTIESSRQSYQLIAVSHRFFGDSNKKLSEEINIIIDKIDTFITKAIPDTKLTLNKYLDAKFEYLSFCLKIKEMEDEEADYLYDEEIAERLSTGNYYYRVQVRCRYLSKKIFVELKTDLSEKMELLDGKNGKYVRFNRLSSTN